MELAKKECILMEAARAFARFGFRKTSVDEIARAAGVAKGTIYLAAESKEDLFYQALHREVRQWVGEVSGLIDPRRPADELRSLGWQNVVEILRLGIKQGLFRDGLDVERVAQTLQDTQIAGYLFHGGRGVTEELMARFEAGLDLVLTGPRVRTA